MVDIVTPAIRSQMMAGIKGKHTKPEKFIKRIIRQSGHHYRLNVSTLPGKPDIVLPDFSAVIFAHGCFWHLHKCHLFKWPSSRRTFWKRKIESNVKTDRRNVRLLKKSGWRVLTVWECALKGRKRLAIRSIRDKIISWLESDRSVYSIRGSL